MDINGLRAFVTVATLESFSAAADHLFLTQPAISKRVAGLEAELGTVLFDRIGRRVTLTEAGRALLPRARELIAQFAELRRIASNLSREVGGVLPMGTSHHVGLRRLPPVLRSFSSRYPGVRLDIRFMDSEAACRAVETGELELAVVTLPSTPPESLYVTEIWPDPLEFVAAAEHALCSAAHLGLSELTRYPAVLPGPGTYTRGILDRAVAAAGLTLNIAISTNYLETLKMLVATGLGWSLLPATMLDASIRRLPITASRLRRSLGLVTRRGRTLSNAARTMIETCRHATDIG